MMRRCTRTAGTARRSPSCSSTVGPAGAAWAGACSPPPRRAQQRPGRPCWCCTETGSPAERLYATAGWTRVGAIPQYATDPAGVPQSTTIFYESLG
jgi:hypothetical protein